MSTRHKLLADVFTEMAGTADPLTNHVALVEACCCDGAGPGEPAGLGVR